MPGGSSNAQTLSAPEPVPKFNRQSLAIVAIISSALLFTYSYITAAPLNHDVAWLLTATQRWVAGQRLYVDIIEINPPLIFLENVMLTGGLLTKQAYIAGVIACIGISTAAVFAQRGPRLAAIASAAMVVSGITDFGQRDHLALIFLVPLLLIEPTTKTGRALCGFWAFLGVGLKPHFALIPAAFVAARCYTSKSLAPIREGQVLVLVGLCAAWLAMVALAWPAYFRTIVPMAALVYQAFGYQPLFQHFAVSLIVMAALILVARRQPELLPLSSAAAGAIAEFFLQGRFWSYQFVPALGLAIIVCVQASIADKGIFRWAYFGVSAILIAWPLRVGPHRYPASILPQGVESVLFFTERVSATYPQVTECGVVNVSRYPSFWTLPGAWRRFHDESSAGVKARALLQQEFATISNDIEAGKPAMIFEDSRPTYFGSRYFAYSRWIDLHGYRRIGKRDRYWVWLRNDLDGSVMNRPICQVPGVGLDS